MATSHPAIGRARRMQVARPELQHQTMIEAVENHMPEVIVIDEIGTELEAQARAPSLNVVWCSSPQPTAMLWPT